MKTVNELLKTINKQFDHFLEAWGSFTSDDESHMAGRVTAMKLAKHIVNKEFDQLEEDI